MISATCGYSAFARNQQCMLAVIIIVSKIIAFNLQITSDVELFTEMFNL